jgi:hypothetical protein
MRRRRGTRREEERREEEADDGQEQARDATRRGSPLTEEISDPVEILPITRRPLTFYLLLYIITPAH